MTGHRSVLAVLGLLLLMPWSGVISETPTDITSDGALEDWDEDAIMESDANNVSFLLTWNETHLNLGWNGTDWDSAGEGADWFVYLNTSTGGSNAAKSWGVQHALPFAADYGFVLENNSYYRLILWDGGEWVDAPTQPEQNSTFIGYSGNKNTEVSIPWSALGNPYSFDILSWAQWEDGGNVWTSFPSQNPASNSGLETFTHAWHCENRSVSVAPNTLPIIALEAAEKFADALNLAIIFHQHQPYYKNKLTGMYEMPWVRVHAMTEYVDSPGILSRYPETKITYNLVPSFVEQLVDYHTNEALDVHTEFAGRAWPLDENGTVSGYPNATARELHTMQFQSFWNSGWIYNVSSDDAELAWLYPSSQRYAQIYGMTLHNLKPATIMNDVLLEPQAFLDLQVLWYLYQFSPDYVLGQYQSIEDSTADGRPAHGDVTLQNLFAQNGGYASADLDYVIAAQLSHMANVLPMYSALAARGQIELTTSPYYHPIMPLLMMDGWTFEDGIEVDKDSWPDDTRNQLVNGMDLFEAELGFRPTGMWPSEQSVSPAMVQPVSDVGIQWMVTDEVNLAGSTDVNGDYIDTSIASNLATPWITTGVDGGEVVTIFRDRVISDRIAFEYGKMTPEDAVSDFINYVDGIRNEILAAGKDPSQHLLTVALDGENWMFMSEFQHHDNARPFTDEWFRGLASHPSIVTTTPSEFLARNTTLPKITTISTGSWIDGTLSTWAGEAEESLGWQRLVEARQALVAFEQVNPTHAGLSAAWESLYIAQGSDWFWWYGLDQDSGYDELWDTLFKVHLSNVYKAIDLGLPPYLQDLWSNPTLPVEPYSGIVEPLIDGVALPGEWEGAAKYDAPNDGGELDFSAFYLGYDATNVYVRIDMANMSNVISATGSQTPDIAIYFMQANAINFNEVETNFRTYYGNEILGFPAKCMVSLNLDDLRSDGRASWILFTAQGKSGDKEVWVGSTPSALGTAAADEVIELQIPWSDLGLAPRYSTRVKVVTSLANSTAYGDGIDLEMAPSAPAEIQLPDLESWVEMLDMADATGDEDGSGDIVYGLSGDFAPGHGLFDLTNFRMMQSSWNVRYEFTFAEMTNIWGMSNGFSHQIVQVYIDQDRVSGSGNIALLEGANAQAHPDWAWEVAISATGEPGAVKAVLAATGETTAKGIEVTADLASKIITITVSKDLVGDSPQDYGYIIVVGSQDGFGPGKWRDVDADAGTWVLGGGDDSADDGIDYDPNILDILLEPDVDQTVMLSAYSTTDHTFAQLSGIEIPEVPQQIFGLSIGVVTGTSAVLTWLTTQAAAATTEYHIAGQSENTNIVQSENSTSHGITLTGLLTNTTYVVIISVDGAISVTLNLTTTDEVDLTPPEILNLAAQVLENGQVRVSWFTSEATTEHLSWIGGEYSGDTVARSKSHQITLTLPGGEYALVVIAVDAAGNSNTSSFIVNIPGDGSGGTAGSGGDDEVVCPADGGCEDETDEKGSVLFEVLASPAMQIVLLVIAILVGLSFWRVGRTEGRTS